MNRYLVLDLDGVRKRTSYGLITRSGPDPVFDEFFTFNVKMAQWVNSTLRVQVGLHACCAGLRARARIATKLSFAFLAVDLGS